MIDGTGWMDVVGGRAWMGCSMNRLDGWAGPPVAPMPVSLLVVLSAPRFRFVPFLLELRAVIDWVSVG